MITALWIVTGSLTVGVLFLIRRLYSSKESRLTTEEQYETIFKTVTDGLIINALDGTIVEANPAACEMHGYTRDEFIGQSAAEFVHPDSLHLFHEYVEALSAGRTFHCFAQDLRKDGSTFDVEVNGIPFQFKGQPHLLGIIRNVTERILADEKLKRTQQALIEQKKKENERVTAELAQARNHLVQSTRLATIGKMAAQIAHEIRNPLGIIKNSAFFVHRKLPEEEAVAREHADLIQHEVAMCVEIIENILSITKITPPRKSLLDLGPFLTDAFRRLQKDVLADDPADGIKCVYDGPPSPFHVHADPLQFRLIVDNLLKNAVEAMECSGEIRISARHEARDTLIDVTDDGPGVPADQMETIFEIFQTSKAKGTGLGLGICRQIIERHGGTLEVVKLDGRSLHPPTGATFRIKMPRQISDEE